MPDSIATMVDRVSRVAALTSPALQLTSTEVPTNALLTSQTLSLAYEENQIWVRIPVNAPWGLSLNLALQSALDLPANWDGYGAQKPQVEPAISLVQLMSASGWWGASPSVSPLPDGGIHAEWNIGVRGVEVEITSNCDVSYVFDNGNDMIEWSSEVTRDQRFVDALGQLG